jgi:hypothetical protein
MSVEAARPRLVSKQRDRPHQAGRSKVNVKTASIRRWSG